MRSVSRSHRGWPAPGVAPGDAGAFVATLAVAIGGAAAAAALAAALVLLMRRLAVPGLGPVASGMALAVALGGAGLVALADAARWRGGGRAVAAIARVGLLLALAAVALPLRVATWRDSATLGLAVAVAAGAVAIRPRPPRPRPADARGDRKPVRSRKAARGPQAEPRVPGRMRQRFTRYDGRGGRDCLQGRINVEVGAGAKTAHGHVGFCPAFAATPAVALSTDYDGVEATVSAAEVLPWGVRVEVRLAEPAEEALEIPVDLRVRSHD